MPVLAFGWHFIRGMHALTHARNRRISGTLFFQTISGDLRAALGAVAASAGGAVASLIGVPVPWLLGSLLVMAGLNLVGLDVGAPRGARQAGQVVIGVAVGLYFSPAVLREITSHLGLMVAAGWILSRARVNLAWLVGPMLVGVAFGVVAARLAGLSVPAIVLATAPGGLPEASITARTLDLGVPLVAAFHLVRLVLIVLLAAPIFYGMRALTRGPSQAGEVGERPARLMLH